VVPLNTTELALRSSMCAGISVKPVTTPASKLTINPILVMACGLHLKAEVAQGGT
jgi:hypothetical protein